MRERGQGQRPYSSTDLESIVAIATTSVCSCPPRCLRMKSTHFLSSRLMKLPVGEVTPNMNTTSITKVTISATLRPDMRKSFASMEILVAGGMPARESAPAGRCVGFGTGAADAPEKAARLASSTHTASPPALSWKNDARAAPGSAAPGASKQPGQEARFVREGRPVGRQREQGG